MTALNRRRIAIVTSLVSIAAVMLAIITMSKRQVRLENARGARVRDDIHTLDARLNRYKVRHGDYPANDLGLSALGIAPKDPWLRDYIYRCPGRFHKDGYDLFSPGPDGKPDTADDDWGND